MPTYEGAESKQFEISQLAEAIFTSRNFSLITKLLEEVKQYISSYKPTGDSCTWLNLILEQICKRGPDFSCFTSEDFALIGRLADVMLRDHGHGYQRISLPRARM